MPYNLLYGEEDYLYDPYDDERKVFDVTLSKSSNAVSYLDFSLGISHPLAGDLAKLDKPVYLYLDGELLFKGKIDSIERDVQGSYTVSCADALSFLEDSLIRPYSTVYGEEELFPNTVYDYATFFEWLIDQHNSNIHDKDKRFQILENEGYDLSAEDDKTEDSDFYKSSSSASTTSSIIENDILDVAGGYIKLEYDQKTSGKDSAINYISLYSDIHETNDQIIEFGSNIADITITDETDEFYSAILPKGGSPEYEDDDVEYDKVKITLDSGWGDKFVDGKYTGQFDEDEIPDGDSVDWSEYDPDEFEYTINANHMMLFRTTIPYSDGKVQVSYTQELSDDTESLEEVLGFDVVERELTSTSYWYCIHEDGEWDGYDASIYDWQSWDGEDLDTSTDGYIQKQFILYKERRKYKYKFGYDVEDYIKFKKLSSLLDDLQDEYDDLEDDEELDELGARYAIKDSFTTNSDFDESGVSCDANTVVRLRVTSNGKLYWHVTSATYSKSDGWAHAANSPRYLYEYDYTAEYQTDFELGLDDLEDPQTYVDDFVVDGDVLYSDSRVAEYGYREFSWSDSDLNTADDVLEQAIKELKKVYDPEMSIEARVVDRSLYEEGYDHLDIGQAVRVRSDPHDIDEYLAVQSIDLDMLDPTGSEYTLGREKSSITGEFSAYLTSKTSTINIYVDSVNGSISESIINSIVSSYTS